MERNSRQTFSSLNFLGMFLSSYPIRYNIFAKYLFDWLNKLYQKSSKINNQLNISIKY